MHIAEKVTILPSEDRRCVKCGRDLPKGRKKYCHYCQPFKAYHRPKDATNSDAEYTLADRVAQADAYGLNYGRFMALLENGGQLPPLRHPVRWPPDSVHRGE